MKRNFNSLGRQQIQKIISTIVLMTLAVIIVFPIFLMVSGSLKTSREISSAEFSVFPKTLQVSNYVTAMKRGKWGRWIYNSVIVTVISTAVSLLLNSMAGFAFARLNFRGKNILFYIALIGLLMPPEVTLTPTYILMAKFPLVGGNDIWGNEGMGFIDTYAGLIIPFIAGSFGVFFARQFYLGFPSSLDDAALIDGCGRIKTFFLIYVPLSQPLFASLGIIKATFAWNQYAWPLVITTTRKMRTVQLALDIFKGEDIIQWNLLLAATAVITLPMLLVFIRWQRAFLQTFVSSGTKG